MHRHVEVHYGPSVGLTTLLLLLLLIIVFNFLCMCMCMRVHVQVCICEPCVCKCPRKLESFKPPETEITSSYEFPGMGAVLGAELGASKRTVSTFTTEPFYLSSLLPPPPPPPSSSSSSKTEPQFVAQAVPKLLIQFKLSLNPSLGLLAAGVISMCQALLACPPFLLLP